jgi:hypothetical protein
MARRRRRGRRSALESTGAAVGRTLGQLAGRWEALDRQRAELAAELARLAKSMAGTAASSGRTLMAELGRRRKGGRPKGFKMSEATKRKLRAAWKRRKAAAKLKAN